jgi:hypothetical protein
MSYSNFDSWMKTKRNFTVHIMDGAEIIAKVEKVKVMVGTERNDNGFPIEFTVFGGNVNEINIGDRYINQIVETGEYWSVFVDGYQHYLFS